MHTVLIAEDDNIIRQTQKQFLEGEGYKVIEAIDGQTLIRALQNTCPDIILLDIILNKDNGLELMKDIKTYTDVPIIVVSSKKDLIDKVLALELGADDYMCKPIEMRELISRIKANVRRYKNDNSKGISKDAETRPPIVFGEWLIDFRTYSVTNREGVDVGLTTAEFNLLSTLAKSPNVVFTREKLFDILKPDNYDSFDRAIDIQIARIRKKFGDDAHDPKIIKTIRNVGYIFIGNKES